MSFVELLLFGIGLSMDAFAVSICKGLSVRKLRPKHAITVGLWFGGICTGVSFACIDVDIVPAIAIIGTTTFILSAVGIKIGNVFGAKYKSKAEFLGGAVLILLGLKILLEDLGLLPF